MKFHVLAGYILALAIVGFFLWLIRGLVRYLRKRNQLPSELPDALRTPSQADESSAPEKIPVAWPVTLFLGNDDIEYPGRLEALTPVGAFLRSSAPLRPGQAVSLYLDVPGNEQCRASAKVLWVGEGKGRSPAAQLRFEGMAAAERERLRRAAGGA